MRREYIERELRDLGIGRVRVIAWEPVHRWAKDSYEIGTWGIALNTRTLADTLDKLCQMRNIEVAA